MTFRFIGKSLPRTEDFRLIRGLGRYTADLAPADSLRLYVLRSPHGAAHIRSIDIAAAQTMPGVQLVLTGDDPELAALGSIPSKVKRKAPDGSPNFEPPYRMLARERALFVGDAVAAVFAHTLDQAKDAAEQIAVDFEPLPTITETRIAADSASPQLWPQSPNNICFIHDAGDRKAVDEALAKARHKISVTYAINRITAVTMEARAALATYDQAGEAYTLYCGLQNPHGVRDMLANDIFRIPGNRIRLVAPDVGGGFGLKEAPFPEYVLAMIGAKRTGRPVLWMAERGESFLSDFHAPRQLLHRDARPRRGRSFPRAQGRHHRQYRRLYFAERAACLHQQSRRSCRRLSHAAYPFAGDRNFLQHAADGAVSRRRAAGSDLRHRARDRHRGKALRLRSGGTAPQEPDRAGSDALQHQIHLHLRFRRVRAQHG